MNSLVNRPMARTRKRPSTLPGSRVECSKLIGSDNRHRKSEKEEDEELLNENKEEEEAPYVFEESAPCMFSLQA